MLNSQMLDAAIGLVFVYFFLSLLCSVIIETVTGLAKKRPRMLYSGILMLLQDPKALDKLYGQPLFMGYAKPKPLIGSLKESFTFLPFKKNIYPSYISSRSFVLSLLESLKQHPDVVKAFFPVECQNRIREFKNTLNSLPDEGKIKQALRPLLESVDTDPAKAFTDIMEWYDKNKTIELPQALKDIFIELEKTLPAIDSVENIKKLVQSLPINSTIRRALLPLLESAEKSMEKALESMEKWYDEAMERVTGWYKRYSQAFALILAFVVALAMNVDTFEVGKSIYRDPAVRNALVIMAQDQSNKILSDKKGVGQGEQTKPGETPSSGGIQKPEKGKQDAGLPSSPPDSKKAPAKKVTPPTAASQSTGSGQSAPEKADLKKKVEKINDMYGQISNINLPIGWQFTETGWPAVKKVWDLFTAGKLLGILITAFMVSLGANFWFDLLNKLLNMRNAGKKPLTKEEQQAQKK